MLNLVEERLKFWVLHVIFHKKLVHLLADFVIEEKIEQRFIDPFGEFLVSLKLLQPSLILSELFLFLLLFLVLEQ